MDTYRIYPAGDRAVVVEYGDCILASVNQQVMDLEAAVRNTNTNALKDAVIEMIPTYRSLMIVYRPERISYDEIVKAIAQCATDGEVKEKKTRRIVEIPVCYSTRFGPDLPDAEKLTGIDREEIIRIHSEQMYRIYMLGFLPGFPYLGGMDERIAMNRLDSPRKKIPAGSVGIGGAQTGIYPIPSPGGWRLIGCTPVELYNPNREEAVPYQAGDYIRFQPIDMDTFYDIRQLCVKGEYSFSIRMEE